MATLLLEELELTIGMKPMDTIMEFVMNYKINQFIIQTIFVLSKKQTALLIKYHREIICPQTSYLIKILV